MKVVVRSRASSPAVQPCSRVLRVVRDELSAPAGWPVLDGVRGVAVLAAVSWHVLRLYPAARVSSDAVPSLLWPFGTLRFSVDTFFVLSGFLVVRSWQSVRRSAGGVRAWVSFMSRRGARILPGYWVSLAVLIPLVAPVLFDQPRRLLAFVTLNQYVKFWLPERVNVVYWSLTTEWHFYLLVPLVSWLLVRVGRWPVLGACLVTSVWWGLSTPLQLPTSFIFGRLDQFVAGAVLGQLVVAHGRGERPLLVRVVRRRHAGTMIVVALLALGTFEGSTFGMGRGTVFDAMLHPLTGLLLAAGLLRVLTGRPPRLLAHPLVRFFGVVSFGLYIWHYPLLQRGRALSSFPTPFPSWLWSTVVVVVLFMLAVAAATISYFFVERPFVRRRSTSRDAATPARAADVEHRDVVRA